MFEHCKEQEFNEIISSSSLEKLAVAIHRA
jgi:hypothetical protein